MAFNYAELAFLSTELLTEFGQTVTVRNYTVPTYSPGSGTATPTYADTTRRGALFDFGRGQVNGPGGLIQQGDKKLLLAPGTPPPSLEDHIIVGGVEYTIAGISESNPAGTAVLYTLHLRS